ncbi:hypothetical protein DICPUDRAFT_77883 [Dictyostelium purpureum]|uniref:MRH domain-containing protein n=1 Tax=Dictyostelium purpureum TaxID=5786 RepID=F0ZHW9_DICPU|nr:uncharacterized protein DICPUDRAFT_77883 [Dictyostelium purpureum]EGC36457.1 hypothetical protein DICPUDRAFT_77883 [Dictyostelium purpureum]|eukprot:XP_003287029.1 hypothetical protein DICPUDRAFT_77883 [Dictyostelium purpureum]
MVLEKFDSPLYDQFKSQIFKEINYRTHNKNINLESVSFLKGFKIFLNILVKKISFPNLSSDKINSIYDYQSKSYINLAKFRDDNFIFKPEFLLASTLFSLFKKEKEKPNSSVASSLKKIILPLKNNNVNDIKSFSKEFISNDLNIDSSIQQTFNATSNPKLRAFVTESIVAHHNLDPEVLNKQFIPDDMVNCIFYDSANHRYIDLNLLKLAISNPYIVTVPAANNPTNKDYKIYFNICGRVERCKSPGIDYPNGCQDYSGKLYNIGDTEKFPETTFSSTGMKIKHYGPTLSNDCLRTMVLDFSCGTKDYEFIKAEEKPACQYNIYIKSKFVCGAPGYIYKDGLFYNLSPLVLPTNTKEPYKVKDASGRDIYFNIGNKLDKCNGYQSCITSQAGSSSMVSLGKQAILNVVTNFKKGLDMVHSIDTQSTASIGCSNSNMQISFVCDPTTERRYSSTINNCNFEITFYSRYACISSESLIEQYRYFDFSSLARPSSDAYVADASGFKIYFNFGIGVDKCDSLGNGLFQACQIYPNGQIYGLSKFNLGYTSIDESVNRAEELQTCVYYVTISSKFGCDPAIYYNKESRTYVNMNPLKEIDREETIIKNSALTYTLHYSIAGTNKKCTDSAKAIKGLDYQSCQIFSLPSDTFQTGGLFSQSGNFDSYGLSSIQYNSNDGQFCGSSLAKRKNIITFTCDKNTEYSVTKKSENPDCTYQLSVKTKFACLSTPHPYPSISQISPQNYGGIGDTITLTGDFSFSKINNLEVYFKFGEKEQLATQIVSRSTSQLKVVVPSGVYYDITIFTRDGPFSIGYPIPFTNVNPNIKIVLSSQFKTKDINRFYVVRDNFLTKASVDKKIFPFESVNQNKIIYCETKSMCGSSTSKISSVASPSTYSSCVDSTIYNSNKQYFGSSSYDIFICVMPSRAIANGSIGFFNYRQLGISTVSYNYQYATPGITSVSLSSARIGQVITITGSDFPPTQESGNISSDWKECSIVLKSSDSQVINIITINWMSSTTIAFTVPEGHGSNLKGYVKVAGRESSTFFTFSYILSAPVLTSIDPPHVETDGLSIVTIVGDNFVPSTLANTINFDSINYKNNYYVLIGTEKASSWKWIDSRRVEVTIPPGIGSFIIKVVVNDQQSNSLTQYYNTPTLKSKLYYGDTNGQSTLTLYGKNFIPSQLLNSQYTINNQENYVMIGNTKCLNLVWIDSTILTCKPPPQGNANSVQPITVTVGNQVTDSLVDYHYDKCFIPCDSKPIIETNSNFVQVLYENRICSNQYSLPLESTIAETEQYFKNYWVENVISDDWKTGQFYNLLFESSNQTISTLSQFINISDSNLCIYSRIDPFSITLNYLQTITSDLLFLKETAKYYATIDSYTVYYNNETLVNSQGIAIITNNNKICSVTQAYNEEIKNFNSNIFGSCISSCSFYYCSDTLQKEDVSLIVLVISILV